MAWSPEPLARTVTWSSVWHRLGRSWCSSSGARNISLPSLSQQCSTQLIPPYDCKWESINIVASYLHGKLLVNPWSLLKLHYFKFVITLLLLLLLPLLSLGRSESHSGVQVFGSYYKAVPIPPSHRHHPCPDAASEAMLAATDFVTHICF